MKETLTPRELSLERSRLTLIHERWGALIDSTLGGAIRESPLRPTILPEFLAALISLESGGNPAATRFEPRVHQHLLRVRGGDETHYGGLTRSRLSQFEDLQLIEFATSWGLTQIMGYHVIDEVNSTTPESPPHRGGEPKAGWCSVLIEPGFNLMKAARMLAEFAEVVRAVREPPLQENDFAQLFRCWNTGKPNGETFDPRYEIGRASCRERV